jgi:hypothetical protein
VVGFIGDACTEPVVVREMRTSLAQSERLVKKERPDMTLWWIGNLILLFVVLPIVVVLMKRIVAPVDRIRAEVDNILHDGVILTGKLDNVPELLAVTDGAVKEIAIGATRYVKRVGHLLGALGV